jgi:hypothetical protein
MTDRYTPAQIYSLVFGATLLLVGILGFVVDSSFDAGSNVQGSNLIAFEVNGWHNLVHIASGALGLLLASAYDGARRYALGFGATYLMIALLGFMAGDGDELFNLIPVNSEDNVFHVLVGVAGLAAGLATPASPAPSVLRAPGP